MLKSVLIWVIFLVFSFTLSSQPQVSLDLSGYSIVLGDTLRLDVFTPEEVKSYGITLGNQNFPLFLKNKTRSGEMHYVSFLAVSRKQFSGIYNLDVNLKFDRDISFKKNFKIDVSHQKKSEGKVFLSRKKRVLATKKSLLSKESKQILKGFSYKTKTPYFKKKQFILPIKGKVTSPFAAIRSYSTGSVSSHAGVDISGKIGKLVRASQAGKVILSYDYDYHGKTVMIDHGFSIVSIYNHLDERYVEKGDIVRRGDYIGTLGQTGVATGPHLHWGMAVNNIRVNPLFWVKNKGLID